MRSVYTMMYVRPESKGACKLRRVNVEVKVVVPEGAADVAWYGGTVIAAMEGFDSMWITRTEYDEVGPKIVHQKCL